VISGYVLCLMLLSIKETIINEPLRNPNRDFFKVS